MRIGIPKVSACCLRKAIHGSGKGEQGNRLSYIDSSGRRYQQMLIMKNEVLEAASSKDRKKVSTVLSCKDEVLRHRHTSLHSGTYFEKKLGKQN